jgi:hypothetical protein
LRRDQEQRLTAAASAGDENCSLGDDQQGGTLRGVGLGYSYVAELGRERISCG